MKDVLLGVCGEGINAECLMVVWSICCTILKTKGWIDLRGMRMEQEDARF